MVVTRFHHSWSWSIKLAQFHTGDGLTGGRNDTNCVSVGIGWYRLGYRWVLPIFLQKQRKRVKPYLLMASVHLNMDFGVSVCNGPLSVMQAS